MIIHFVSLLRNDDCVTLHTLLCNFFHVCVTNVIPPLLCVHSEFFSSLASLPQRMNEKSVKNT